MELKTFLKLKKSIDQIIEKLKEEALANGENIASVEFEQFLQLAKEKLLNERGISLSEYEQIFEDMRKRKSEIKKKKQKQSDLLLSQIEKIKGERGETGKDGYTPIKGKDYFDGKPGKDADENKIIQEVIKKIPIPKDGKPGKDGKTIIKEIIKEKEIDKTELLKLQTDFADLYDKVNKLDIPKPIDINLLKKEISEDNANYINGLWGKMPDWRQAIMGLDGRISVLESDESTGEVNKIIASTNVSISPASGVGNVTIEVPDATLATKYLKLDQTTAQTITASPILNWLTAGRMTYMDSSKKIVDSPHIITSSPFSLLDLQSSVETKGSAEFVGTGTVGASGTTVTGSGTLFLTEAKIGWKIRTTAGNRTITAIASNTSLTVDSSFSQSSGRAVNFTPAPYVYRDNSNNVLSYYDLANDRYHLLKPLYPTQGLTGPSGVNTTSFGNDAWKVVSQNNNEGDGISVWYNNLTGYLGLGPNWISGSNTIYISSNHANHDDGLEFQDNSGNSYIKGKSVGYWGSASSRKTFNVGMNSEGTALHNVQPTGSCSGTPDACNTFMSETPCNNQDGCSWGYHADSCTGSLVCANQGSQAACEAIGCTWTSNPCSVYNNDYANCALNSPPCSWECSSCSIWNEDETNCQSHSSGQTGCDNCTWNAGSPSDCYGSQTTNCAQWNNDQTNCELNGTYCNWNDPNCTDKGCDTWDSDESTCGSAGCSWTPAVASSCTGTYTTGNCNGTLSESCTGSPSTSCSAMDERCGGSSNCVVFGTQEACNVYYPTCWWDGMTCQNYLPCSELEAQGQGVCEGAGCTWTAQTCTAYSNHGGDCTYQSAGNYCTGTPNACNTFTSSTPCTEQVGCSWAYGDAYWGDGNFMTTASFKMLNAITDAQAPNGSFFIGSEHSNKACFKNLSGNVVELY
jgi:hypothetical protein